METFTFQIKITVIREGYPTRQHFETIQASTVDRAEQIALKRYCDYWKERIQDVNKYRSSKMKMEVEVIDTEYKNLPLLDKQLEFKRF